MIETQNLTKEYRTDSGKINALDNVSLRIERGQRVGILGKNGSGKSTLIRLIGRVERPTSGKIIHGMTTSWPIAFRGGFGSELTAYENLRFLCRVYDRTFEPLAEYVREFTELGSRLYDPINTYSSGMRAKFSFGISCAFEFDCYLIDEVFAVGDQQFRRKCKQELFEKRHDRALLMVSHQPQTIQSVCEIGILIEGGRHVDTFDIRRDRKWLNHATP